MMTPSQTANYSVLIVDDDRLSREVLTILLEAQGYQVRAASGGEEAITLLSMQSLDGSSPQAVLADLQMPGITGNELAERLKGLVDAPLRLLAMSAREPEPHVVASYDSFLRKPICMSSLALALRGSEQAESAGAEPCSAASTKTLDNEVYATLEAAMSADQMAQLYRFFVADACQRVERMRVALGSQDEIEFRKQAHTLRGGCGMVGALEMRVLAERMEERGFGRGTRLELDSLLDDLSHACERMRSMLEARRRSDV